LLARGRRGGCTTCRRAPRQVGSTRPRRPREARPRAARPRAGHSASSTRPRACPPSGCSRSWWTSGRTMRS
jgi:hypothetical protein